MRASAWLIVLLLVLVPSSYARAEPGAGRIPVEADGLPVDLGAGLPDSVLVVTEEWSPYVQHEGDISTGLDYEVVRIVFERMGVRAEIRFFPWRRCLKLIADLEADAILDVAFTDDRGRFMHFPVQHLSESKTVFFHNKDGAFRFGSMQDLAGKVIGILPGYSYGWRFDTATNFSKETGPRLDANFQKLVKGRLDAVAANLALGLATLERLGLTGAVVWAEEPIQVERNYVAFAHKEGYDVLARRFGEELAAFMGASAYRDIRAAYGRAGD